MITFERFTLENGLTVLVNSDPETPLVAFNMLYKVGARHEDPERTGFAHLFEHLMFGGSKNIAEFDKPIQAAGGNSNAFTNNDFTNYYIILPGSNIETAFWLESDRMLELDFSPRTLDIQRQVVIEEYKQRYLNQPYGDVWLLLRPLAYQVHPYRWATIGKEIQHIEKAALSEVKEFFYQHYTPNNAILSLSGNISSKEATHLVKKWFGPLPVRKRKQKNIAPEPPQHKKRTTTVTRPVPGNAIYKAFHMGDRLSDDFFCADLMSDLLAGGPSSRFNQHLIKEKKIFNQADAYITGSVDPGLFVVSGNLNPGISMAVAEEALTEELDAMRNGVFTDNEIIAMKNKAESAWIYSRMKILNKAISLAFFEMLGDAHRINSELDTYKKVTHEDLNHFATRVFREENSNVLYYQGEKI